MRVRSVLRLGVGVLALVAATTHPTRATASTTPVTFEWVTVGDPGNARDTEVMASDRTTGYGSVPYTYDIGKYLITTAQYAAFLNGVASKSDPYLLYHPCLDHSACYNAGSGISRKGSPGNYHYSA